MPYRRSSCSWGYQVLLSVILSIAILAIGFSLVSSLVAGGESALSGQGSQFSLSGPGSDGQDDPGQTEPPALPPSPEAATQQAWEMARTSGTYLFESKVAQTTYLLPKLTNAGRSPREEHLVVVGEIDQPAGMME